MLADNHSHIEDKIIQFILGELAENERNAVSLLIENDADAQKLYQDYQKIFSNSKSEHLEKRFNVDNAIQSFRSVAINESSVPTSSRSLFYWIAGVAASVILAVGLFFINAPNNEVPVYSVLAVVDSVHEALIEDGTQITLNHNTSLSYNVDAMDSRIVTIDSGEVFFSVAKDSLRPFIIHANNITVTVLGTSFNVNAKHTDHTVVSVQEGIVSVTSTSGHKQILKAKQEAVFYQDDKAETVQLQSNLNAIHWKTGVLSFENAHFNEFIPEIEQAYSVTIVYDTLATQDFMLTSKFNNQPVEAVLQILSATFNLPLHTLENETYYLGEKKVDSE